MKPLLILSALLAILLLIAWETRAQTPLEIRIMDSIWYSISSKYPSYEYNSDGVFKYRGKTIDTCKAVCDALNEVDYYEDSIRESKFYGWAYTVRVPANIDKHSITGILSTTEDLTKERFVYNKGSLHTWQYYYNKGYRIVKVKIYEY